MAYKPKHQHQLGRPTGSTACGPVSVSVGIDYVTRGDKRPGIMEIRRRMDKLDGPTNVWDAERAVESFSYQGKRLRYRKLFSIADVKQAVKAGYAVQVGVNYGVWNDRMGATGSSSFQGGHSLLIVGQKKWADGTPVWLVFDSLEDGRRSGVPDGPKWRPRWKIVDAMEAHHSRVGSGKCYAGRLAKEA